MDLGFIGPIVGGLLALAGTLYLAFSHNKRESVAAAERQLHAWQAIVHGTESKDVGGGVETDWSRFIAQGPFLSGDEEARTLHYEISRALADQWGSLEDEQQTKYEQLREIGWDRIILFSKIVEDMKRRGLWTFSRTDYVHNPKDYRFRTSDETGKVPGREGPA